MDGTREIDEIARVWAIAELRGDTIEAGAGQMLVVPAGMPHTYVNPGRTRYVDIHASGRMSAEWLEE